MIGHLARVGLIVLAGVAVLQPVPVQAQGLDGKAVYKAANCVGCHKWHGGGGGGYGGAALSLRDTFLDRGQLIEVVRCGRPATRMPYHDRKAWRGQDCYGSTKESMGADLPPGAAKFLRPAEIEAVADYVMTVLKGRGAPDKAACEAFWGDGSRQCQSY